MKAHFWQHTRLAGGLRPGFAIFCGAGLARRQRLTIRDKNDTIYRINKNPILHPNA
jgi:hypothetical protein